MIILLKDESGQALTEYALILGLIFIASAAILTQLGISIKDVLYPTDNELVEMFGINN